MLRLVTIAALGVVGLAGAGAVGGAASAAADESDDEMAALQARIAREELRNRYLSDETASLEDALVETERGIVERLQEADRLESERRAAQVRRAGAEARLGEIRAELEALRRRAGRRAAAMHRTARLGPEAFWLGIEDPVRARRTEDYLRFVLEHDAALARAIRDKAREKDAQIRRLVAEEERLQQMRERTAAEAEELDRLRAARQVLLEALSLERARSDRIADLLVRARREGARAARFEGGRGPAAPPAPGGFDAQRGLLMWPTAGRVEVTFGAKVHPAGVIVRQTGIDIRGDAGQPVVAVFDGRVAHARRRPGLGRLVVLEHEGGWFTVYAHLDALAVEPGQRVPRGARLGDLGASDSRKGPYLYFEVRRGDSPVDPLAWLHR